MTEHFITGYPYPRTFSASAVDGGLIDSGSPLDINNNIPPQRKKQVPNRVESEG